jgi:D-alanyl-D-alanine carboxypeptidase
MRFSINDYSIRASDKGWGRGWPADRSSDMARVTTERSNVAVNVHKRIARLVDLLLDETERRGYLAKAGQTWGYCNRPIRGTTTPSNHSWGLAVDLNSLDNPDSRDGIVHTKMPDWLPRLWNRYGLAWGGAYRGNYKDPMHLEFMGAPADADDMTRKAIDDGIGSMPLNRADKLWLAQEIRDAVNAHADKLFRWEDHGGGDPPAASPPNHPHSHKAILDRIDALERRLRP